MSGPYDDILLLPRPVSKKHPPMAPLDRAAQFSPFAALTGYGAAIAESGRLTDERIELDESEKAALGEKLGELSQRPHPRPLVTLTYFLADGKKAGGAYVSVTGTVKKLDEYRRLVLMAGGEKVPIEDIVDIELP